MIQAPAIRARPCLRLLACMRKQTGYSEALFTTNPTPSRRSIASHSRECDAVKYNAALVMTKPQSARPVETRKSQLIRTYTSLLRTTPLILFFQHSNLTATEWAAVRRELKKMVECVPPSVGTDTLDSHHFSSRMQLQVVRTNMLSVALRIVEFHRPDEPKTVMPTRSGARAPTHDLSDMAYKAAQETNIPPDSAYAQLEPLLMGPLAALILPIVSPAHLAAALAVLSPMPGKFPAPTRKKSAGYYDPICQNGLAKLLLVGGRIEGRIFDQSELSQVGSIQGGTLGLRSQLVGLLQEAGLVLAESLEAGSQSLWVTLEGRRTQLINNGKQG